MMYFSFLKPSLLAVAKYINLELYEAAINAPFKRGRLLDQKNNINIKKNIFFSALLYDLKKHLFAGVTSTAA
ncbi:MAG: hypothetical protein GY874_07340 [Desulfobacteraceae bacterium]|nr:hypothetical protein [Desulfobacteraceae bacterium]